MRLFPDNSRCDGYNRTSIVALKMPICKILAVFNPSASSRYDEEHFHGLKKCLFISVNSRITLVTNILEIIYSYRISKFLIFIIFKMD